MSVNEAISEYSLTEVEAYTRGLQTAWISASKSKSDLAIALEILINAIPGRLSFQHDPTAWSPLALSPVVIDQLGLDDLKFVVEMVIEESDYVLRRVPREFQDKFSQYLEDLLASF